MSRGLLITVAILAVLVGAFFGLGPVVARKLEEQRAVERKLAAFDALERGDRGAALELIDLDLDPQEVARLVPPLCRPGGMAFFEPRHVDKLVAEIADPELRHRFLFACALAAEQADDQVADTEAVSERAFKALLEHDPRLERTWKRVEAAPESCWMVLRSRASWLAAYHGRAEVIGLLARFLGDKSKERGGFTTSSVRGDDPHTFRRCDVAAIRIVRLLGDPELRRLYPIGAPTLLQGFDDLVAQVGKALEEGKASALPPAAWIDLRAKGMLEVGMFLIRNRAWEVAVLRDGKVPGSLEGSNPGSMGFDQAVGISLAPWAFLRQDFSFDPGRAMLGPFEGGTYTLKVEDRNTNEVVERPVEAVPGTIVEVTVDF